MGEAELRSAQPADHAEPRVSVLIVAKDEAHHLAECLAAAGWADERVVVVDSSSRDATLEIAERGADVVAVRDFDHFAGQRNEALARASGDWVLAIDADERATPALAAEIRRVISDPAAAYHGFRVPIQSEVLGRPFVGSGTQHDRPLRLFRRASGRWIGLVHETVELHGPAGSLRNPLRHRTIPTVRVFLEKINHYTTLEAAELARSHRPYRGRDLTLRPLWTFFKLYVLKQGFRDGGEGFLFCLLSGVSAAVRAWKHRELTYRPTRHAPEGPSCARSRRAHPEGARAGIRPEGAPTNQPRATPWDWEDVRVPALKGPNRAWDLRRISRWFWVIDRGREISSGSALSGLWRWGSFLGSQGVALGWFVAAPSGPGSKGTTCAWHPVARGASRSTPSPHAPRPTHHDPQADYEAVVAARFDALQGRFKHEVGEGDPRLLGIIEGLRPLAGRRVLDLGCGKGRFARALRERGARVVGLDVSAAMLAAAAGAGLDRVRGSARRLPFPAASFDRVVAVEVFEHLAPRAVDAVCGEVRRVLRPGGSFVVIDKNVYSLSARRPWLPSAALKWVDERRGRWMYSHRDAVRERWFRPGGLRRRLARWFPEVRVVHLLAPAEAGRFPFQQFPGTRLLALWAARAPGGSA